MDARKKMTIRSTYALVIMSVVYAVVGFTTHDHKTVAQMLALTATLGIFSWLLSEALETYLEHRRHKNWRRHPTAGLALFALAVEIHLVHFGVAWLFPELGSIAHYLISAGFSTMTVFAKASFGHIYPTETVELEDSTLADTLEDIGGSSNPDVQSVIAA